MHKLNDLQSILLATAVQRDGGSLYPLPDAAMAAGPRVTKALIALIKAGFAEERETAEVAAVSRIHDDVRLGLYITAAGSDVIGVGEGPGEQAPLAVAPLTPVARTSKTSAVVALLHRDDGATLPELIAATGWLPHTTRAALTGLRKKGHSIDRGKRDDATCYRIVTASA